MTSRFYEIDIDASCQWNKYGFEISWLWHENTVFYFPTINLCIVVLNWVTFILYSSFTNPLERCLSGHTRQRWCACLHVTSRFYEIDIRRKYLRKWKFRLGLSVVNEINVVLKFLDFDTKIQYFIFRQYLCIVVLNWFTFHLYSLSIILFKDLN